MKKWIRAAGIRAIRTFAQGCLALIGANAIFLSDVNWVMVISGGAMAAVVSLLMSMAGLPELKGENNANSRKDPDEE